MHACAKLLSEKKFSIEHWIVVNVFDVNEENASESVRERERGGKKYLVHIRSDSILID